MTIKRPVRAVGNMLYDADGNFLVAASTMDHTLDAAKAIVSAIAALLNAPSPTRSDVIEECAAIADRQIEIYTAKIAEAYTANLEERIERMENYKDAAEYIADAIRALKARAHAAHTVAEKDEG